MQDWAANTMRELTNKTCKPVPLGAIVTPTAPTPSNNFTSNVMDVNQKLEFAMNEVEHLVYKFCGAAPVPDLDRNPPEQGIVVTMIWALNQQRAMIDRINTAVQRLNESL